MNWFKPTLMGAAAAALVFTTTTALAGSGVGGVFNLGVVNSVDGQTTLTGNPAGSPELKVVSQGTGAAVRGEAGSGIGVNGISVSGTGQQGQTQTGIGLLGIHSDPSGVNAGVEGRTISTDPAGAGVLGRNSGGGPGLKAIVNAGAPPLSVNSSAKVTNLNADLLDGLDSARLWKLGGNAGTTPSTDFLGTTDNTAFELKVNGQRAFRLEPDPNSPNLIGGSASNTVVAGLMGATIAGGGAPSSENRVTGGFGTVGGGWRNTGGGSATVAGGEQNTASGNYSAAAGGQSNSAGGHFSAVGGGHSNTASGAYSAVAGGADNTASSTVDTVGGGSSNTASGSSSTVAGGYQNIASGGASTVPGGSGNTASGGYSFAAGLQAKATQGGSFVWADSTSPFAGLTSPAENTFTVRASGGIWLGTDSSPAIAAGHFIDTSTGAYLSSAGAWTSNSDKARKHGFRRVNARSTLEKVARMPITSWSYKAEKPQVRHIGPMAQDFYKAFGLGLDNKHITTIDEGGVALAAIQGLYRENQTVHRENLELRRTNADLSKRVDRLEQAMARLATEVEKSHHGSAGGGER